MSHQPTINPTPKQHLGWEYLRNNTHNFIIYGGAAGGGKTWLGCEWILTNCYMYPGTRYFIARKELKRLMASSYASFQKVCKYHKIPETDWKLNGQYNYIDFVAGAAKGSRIDLLDADTQPRDPDFGRFGSLEYTSGWLEEAGEIDFGAFDVLKSRIGRQSNKEFNLTPKIFITCNPTKNWLYRDVYKPHRDKTLPDNYVFISALYGDNPHTAEEYGKVLEEIKNPATKQRLMYGNWEYDDDPSTLIDYEAITDLFTNSLPQNNPTEESLSLSDSANQKYITADIARFGQDSTVIMYWEGFHVKDIITKDKQSIQQTTLQIREYARQKQVPYSHIIIDDDGVGGGVVDFMPGTKGFVNNSTPITDPLAPLSKRDDKGKPIKEQYKNLKSQCYFLLADKVNLHQIAITETDTKVQDKIIQELEQVKQHDADKESKLQVLPKDRIKELIGRSPDYSDALMMRMYATLKPNLSNTVKTIQRRQTFNDLNSAI